MESGTLNFVSDQQPEWGGNWTDLKNDIVVDYAKAYLTVMKDRKYWKLLYFDGFAGAGKVISNKENDVNVRFSAAMRILSIEKPRSFNMYYLVELNSNNAINLENRIKETFAN